MDEPAYTNAAGKTPDQLVPDIDQADEQDQRRLERLTNLLA